MWSDCCVPPPLLCFAFPLACKDAQLFNATIGDPSWQSEWELLAVLVSLRIFAEELNGGWVALESDNTATLQAALDFRASSPLMLALAAEVSLELEANSLELQFAHHIRGVANYEADALSRLSLGAAIPARLQAVPRRSVPRRDRSWYRAWPA